MSRIAGHFTYIAVVTALGTALLVAVPASAAERVRVGDGPFISAGGFFIARDKGYFQKMGIEIETFQDGSLAVPSVVSGELEFAAMTASASLFNSVPKGAPLVVILDRGHNRPGLGNRPNLKQKQALDLIETITALSENQHCRTA